MLKHLHNPTLNTRKFPLWILFANSMHGPTSGIKLEANQSLEIQDLVSHFCIITNLESFAIFGSLVKALGYCSEVGKFKSQNYQAALRKILHPQLLSCILSRCSPLWRKASVKYGKYIVDRNYAISAQCIECIHIWIMNAYIFSVQQQSILLQFCPSCLCLFDYGDEVFNLTALALLYCISRKSMREIS